MILWSLPVIREGITYLHVDIAMQCQCPPGEGFVLTERDVSGAKFCQSGTLKRDKGVNAVVNKLYIASVCFI